MSEPARFRIGPGEVVLVSSVQGLVAERTRVLEALEKERPDVLAIGLSPESVAALLRYERDPEVDPFEELPDHEFVYSLKLREFGDVDLPAPDLVAALAWAREQEVPSFGVDLSEEAYETRYVKEVSAFGLLRYGRVQRKLAKRPPRAGDARSFSLAWDAAVRRVKGIGRMEAAREAQIAAGAVQLAGEGKKVLLLVDAPREAGVRVQLEAASSGLA